MRKFSNQDNRVFSKPLTVNPFKQVQALVEVSSAWKQEQRDKVQAEMRKARREEYSRWCDTIRAKLDNPVRLKIRDKRKFLQGSREIFKDVDYTKDNIKLSARGLKKAA